MQTPRLRILAATVASLLCPTLAQADDELKRWPVFTTRLSQPSAQAVEFFVNGAGTASGAAAVVGPRATLEAVRFCSSLREGVRGFYVATLQTYRDCFPDAPQLDAMNFPFLARDWVEARDLLNGPIGLAVAEALRRKQTEVFNYWQGDARVLASASQIASAADLKGRKVLGARSYASATAAKQAGAASVGLPAGEVVAALDAGLADTADLPLTLYQQAGISGISGILNRVLLSNHALDPYVVSAPVDALRSLSGAQRGFLEGLLQRATSVQILAAQAEQQSQLAALRDSGVSVLDMSDQVQASFKATQPPEDVRGRAAQVVESSPGFISSAVASQYGGAAQSTYVRVFFATNRKLAGKTFSAATATELVYGSAEVELEYDRQVSMPAELIGTLLSFGPRGSGTRIAWSTLTQAFPQADLPKTQPGSPTKAPLVYVHGFANSFEEALRRGAWLGWNAKRPVLVFAWPSAGAATPDAYRADQRTADLSATALARVFGALGGASAERADVDVVVHSMGARVTLAALGAVSAGGTDGRPPNFRQLVLVAPDVASKALQDQGNLLQRFFSRKATLYVSDHDLALGISRRFMNPIEGPRAGLAPPVLESEEIESIFIGPNDNSFTGHSYHVMNGLIASDLMEALRYGTPAAERMGVQAAPDGRRFFEIERLKGP